MQLIEIYPVLSDNRPKRAFMRNLLVLISGFSILALSLFACSPDNTPTTAPPETQQSLPTPSNPSYPSYPSNPNSQLPAQGSAQELFREVPEPANRESDPPEIARTRFVDFNADTLIDPNENPKEMPPGSLLKINLFPDVNYTGVIDQIQENGPKNYAWIGFMQGVEYSYLYIIYTDGVFIGHFASPEGVYEVRYKKDGMYQVVLIDQTKLPQE